jgi:ABC-type transporter Mla MlaB component
MDPQLPPREPPRPPRELVLTVEGPITAATIAELCGRLRAVLEGSDVSVLSCDVKSIAQADVAALDALARLQLTARRMGRSVRLRHVSNPLHDLLHLTGWSAIVPCCTDPPAHHGKVH